MTDEANKLDVMVSEINELLMTNTTELKAMKLISALSFVGIIVVIVLLVTK